MNYGPEGASRLTGFPASHIRVIQQVANRLKTMVSFRSAGEHATGLIEEHYGMKGFRIDTKSCDWGPMCGFVCMDPRLSKAGTTDSKQATSYQHKNLEWTAEALQGSISKSFFGMDVQAKSPFEQAAEVARLRANWTASAMPIAISERRLQWLMQHENLLHGTMAQDGDAWTGCSIKAFGEHGSVKLDWRLVPIVRPYPTWAPALQMDSPPYYALCVDGQLTYGSRPRWHSIGGEWKRQTSRAWQYFAPNVSLVTYRNYECILGLCNPGTAGRGFKAVVTADYDLFSIAAKGNDERDLRQMSKVAPSNQLQWNRGRWRSAAEIELFAQSHGGFVKSINDKNRKVSWKALPADGRVRSKELHTMGNVSQRLKDVAAAVNDALKTVYHGGIAVHHNDEAGNFGLPKGGLMECMPVLVLMPNIGSSRILGAAALTSVDDFRQWYQSCLTLGLNPHVKDAWLKEAGI